MLDPEQAREFLPRRVHRLLQPPQRRRRDPMGLLGRRHWLPEAAVYSRGWDLRPHGQAWKTLMDEWKTDTTVVTGADGTATLRGFKGNYTVECGTASCQAKLTAPKRSRRVGGCFRRHTQPT